VSGERIVAIHQPNFFPWLGYFDKIARADVFVILDSVQFPKKQGNWMNRVQILVQGVPRWLTVPVERSYHGLRAVREMRIADDPQWRERSLKTLRVAYGRAPHFESVIDVAEGLFRSDQALLAEFNLGVIEALMGRVVRTPATLVRSSELAVTGSATDLLIAITKAVGGTTYLCGGGADAYQDDARFAEAGLVLRFQEFDAPAYTQLGSSQMIKGLSTLDALFTLGFEGTASLIGQRAPSDHHVTR
jgi:hypothetical protein